MGNIIYYTRITFQSICRNDNWRYVGLLLLTAGGMKSKRNASDELSATTKV